MYHQISSEKSQINAHKINPCIFFLIVPDKKPLNYLLLSQFAYTHTPASV